MFKFRSRGVWRFRVAISLCLLFSVAAGSILDRGVEAKGQDEQRPGATFTPGNLAVFVANASATNTTGSVIELLPGTASQPSPVQTVAIPGTGASGLRFSGSATSTGYLSRTDDGTLLGVMGVNTADTTSNVNTLNPRAVGTVTSAATYSIATTYTGTLTGNPQTRSATSINNSNWFVADQNGIYTNSATAPSPSGNFRAIKSFGGTVYVGQSSSTATNIQVSTVSAPSGGTITGLPGMTNNASHQDFYLIQSGSNGTTFDVLYVLSATSNTAGTISKFSLVSGSWTSNGSYTTTFGGFGLAAAPNGSGGAFLYASTGLGALTANSLIRLTDTAGFNSAINISTGSNLTLYTTATGTIMKGVAFAPVAAATNPEINITGNGTTIVDGSTVPSLLDYTDFGNVNTGSFFDRTYTIQNTGTGNLTVGTISITGTGASDFSVQTAPVSPVAPSSSTTFTLRFTPSVLGLRSASVSIVNNDSNENPYDFAIQGTGTGNSAPTIAESTVSTYINLPAAGPGSVSAVLGDSTDPVRFNGIDFTVNDAETSASSLTVTATSNNQTVVPNANIALSGSSSVRNLKVIPTAVGYASITVTVSDGALTSSYVLNYAASVPVSTPVTTHWHTGKSDASTVQPVDSNYMFVGDDEDQGLRLYNRNSSGLPVSTFDFTASLNLPEAGREVDIEGSARSGNTIYWIGSHGNSSTGGNRPNRSRLFTTNVTGSAETSSLVFGGYYDGLKADLIAWDNSGGHGLGNGYLGLDASAVTGIAPEAAGGVGFNIEGLEFAPDNTTLYICFRAPLEPVATRTKALIVPVTNAAALVAGSPGSGPATFGAPIFLDLGGRGIREIRKNASNEYLIIAGSFDATSNFRVYSWNGDPGSQPLIRPAQVSGLNPEAIGDIPTGLNSRPGAAVNVQLISDNGDDVYYNDGVIAKDLSDNNLKKYRNDLVLVGLAPSAAGVTVSGRALTPFGTGISGARVELRNAAGDTISCSTNQFGYFILENVPSGEAYFLSAKSRRFDFATQLVTVLDDISEIVLIGEYTISGK